MIEEAEDQEEALGPGGGDVTREGERPAQHEGGQPTHVLWREDSVEFVDANEPTAAYDPENLKPLPPDFVADWMKPDFVTCTFVLDVARLDTHLHAKIDGEAGAIRLQFITDIPGQQGTYLEKEKQALRFLAGGPESDWPMIAGEALARGIPPYEMAEIIVGIAAQWRYLDSKIETARIGAKLAVTNAQTVPEKFAAANVDWAALLAA